jgi:hypothetical protein
MSFKGSEVLETDSVIISIRGYGGNSSNRNLTLTSDSFEYILTARRFPHWANLHHAKEEMRLQEVESSPIIRVVKLLLRAISIGASRGDHFAGLWNGFESKVSISKESLRAAPQICNELLPVALTRHAAKSGFLTETLDSELERTARRFSSDSHIFITEIDYPSSFIPSFSYLRCNSEFPKSVFGSETIRDTKYEEITSVHNDRNVNRFFRFRNVLVSQDGVCVTSDNRPLIEINSYVATDYWPSCLWKSPSIDTYLIPNSKNLKSISEQASYHHTNSNWAHFIEDDLPIIYGLFKLNQNKILFLSSNLDAKKAELLAAVLPDLKFQILPRLTQIYFDDVLLAHHVDSRNKHIAGSPSSAPMTDQEILKAMRHQLKIDEEQIVASKRRIYISRGQKGLRRLVNEDEVRNLLEKHSFQTINAEDLPLQERLNLFKNASFVVGETGAGMANLYFTTSQAKIIELRHPGVRASTEHLSLVKTVGFDYSIIQGELTSKFRQLRFGSDSFRVNLRKLDVKLQSLLRETGVT